MVSSVVIVCLNGRRQRLEHLEVVLCGYLWTMNMSASQHPLLPMPGLQGSDGFLRKRPVPCWEPDDLQVPSWHTDTLLGPFLHVQTGDMIVRTETV